MSNVPQVKRDWLSFAAPYMELLSGRSSSPDMKGIPEPVFTRQMDIKFIVATKMVSS